MKGNKFLSFLIVCLALTAFLAGYIMVKRGASTGPQTGTILDKFNGQATDKQPSAPKTGPEPILLTDRQVTFAINSSNKGGVLYYEKNTGKIFEVNTDDKTEQVVSDKTFSDLNSVIWSPNRKETLNFLNPPSGSSLKYYSLSTSSSVDLGSNIQSAAFSPDGNLVAYYYFDESTQDGKIMMTQPNGLYQKKILNTRLKDVSITWPSKDNMAIRTGADVFLLTEGGSLTKLIEGGLGFEEKWSPSGKKLLFSVFSGDTQNPSTLLWLKDVESKEEIPSELIGSANQCVWSIDDIHIFCSIPDSSSADVIYKINTNDWSSKMVAEPMMSVKELLLSNLEDNLIFISATDEKLYSIKISN